MRGQQTGLGPNVAHHLFLKIKFYWNTAMPFHTCTVCGCFHSRVEFSRYDTYHMSLKPKIFTFWPFMGKFAEHRILGTRSFLCLVLDTGVSYGSTWGFRLSS